MVKVITSKTGSKDIATTSQPDEEERLLIELLRLLETELKAIQRHILFMRYLENFSLYETAFIVGKSMSNVKAIQNRALAKLNQQFNRLIGDNQPGSAVGADP